MTEAKKSETEKLGFLNLLFFAAVSSPGKKIAHYNF
jgi:hypothetical protein